MPTAHSTGSSTSPPTPGCSRSGIRTGSAASTTTPASNRCSTAWGWNRGARRPRRPAGRRRCQPVTRPEKRWTPAVPQSRRPAVPRHRRSAHSRSRPPSRSTTPVPIPIPIPPSRKSPTPMTLSRRALSRAAPESHLATTFDEHCPKITRKVYCAVCTPARGQWIRKQGGRMATVEVRDDRSKALNVAIAQIERAYGKGSIMRMGADGARTVVEAISTGAINLDAAIGIGGIPRGRITEIYGPESSGKTTLCLHVIANAQRNGGVAAFIDAEHALDIEYARKLGVDIENLLVSQPDTGEQALEIAELLIRSNAVDVVVVDSVAALVPRAEIEGEMGDSHVGLQARL